jgi:hypothetical protein
MYKFEGDGKPSNHFKGSCTIVSQSEVIRKLKKML